MNHICIAAANPAGMEDKNDPSQKSLYFVNIATLTPSDGASAPGEASLEHAIPSRSAAAVLQDPKAAIMQAQVVEEFEPARLSDEACDANVAKPPLTAEVPVPSNCSTPAPASIANKPLTTLAMVDPEFSGKGTNRTAQKHKRELENLKIAYAKKSGKLVESGEVIVASELSSH
ncbi:hypothetical protein M427DRAFT_43298 [Gonapodya prolifera JEL478]|uniref:Uncharacterized protein n=1 Tax=Gonapodya prolifera (strain JEL478) TaxID=1344416 RepID=A0A139AJT5_GONPJ|nr:hypothetical protein M427DRAFT_43298 [Gonapodya prolifera JEL478]|eukprot:KXS17042.1 hypothetical protein M427DRAFT_43298 [Gonapodya prolifera JEL478]